jgi:hypothetical protein
MVFDEAKLLVDVETDRLVTKFKNDGGMLSTGAIISLVIGLVVLAALLPTAITSLNGANTTGWTTTQTAIWAVLGIIVLAVVVMKISE